MIDNGRVVGFPAFPPRRGRSTFGRSWWSRAWITAVEDIALDPEELRRGRQYAQLGRVGSITVSPGRIAAPVHDSDDALYHAVVRVEQLIDTAWERFLDQVAAKAGHLAALLDRDLPHELVEAAAHADVRLLPGLGDLEPECECPGWEHPCQHAAALCYQAAWLLDDNPFVLLLMRGRGEQELLAQFDGHSMPQPTPPAAAQGTTAGNGAALAPGPTTAQDPTTARSTATDPEPLPGTPAELAYAQVVAPLPDPPPLPTAAPSPLVLPSGPGIDPAVLARVAADAAALARELLTH
ncbi:MAG TPA: SWIM zinc finger family protein [Pseudonocardiaceae bacterium]|nr:SWIM zinc finger family protein [Pseudonocardiaceae bacterium]